MTAPIGDSAPAATMQINVARDAPPDDAPAIRYRDRYYALNDTPGDRLSFAILSILFRAAVGEIENVGAPITIAK